MRPITKVSSSPQCIYVKLLTGQDIYERWIDTSDRMTQVRR